LSLARPADLQQRLLAASSRGETHARGCLLDHAAELQQLLAALTSQSSSASTSLTPRSSAPPSDEPRHGGDVSDQTA
jgi:hypothetical protein